MTNTAKLKSKIVENGMTQLIVAQKIGITPTTLNYKINNKIEFRAGEIQKLSMILNLNAEELSGIFFTT